MLLAIDIGNTNINFGVFKGSKIINVFSLATQNYRISALKKKLRSYKIKDSIICSVVPKVTTLLERDIRILLKKRPFVVGKNIRVAIKNKYRNPKQVGPDRIVNAVAAVHFFGSPVIAVDYGTAVTFDIISRKKEYLGGMIIPGLQVSLDALHKRTALLPKIKLQKPAEFIGRDTKTSMLSGVIYGFCALTDDLVCRIKEKIGRNAKVIATGGDIGLIRGYCKKIDKFEPLLTLKGLYLIYNNRKEGA